VMTAEEAIRALEGVGGRVELADGDRVLVRAAPSSLAPILRAMKRDIVALLRRRDSCYIHGPEADFWERPEGGRVCGQCHPDPRSLPDPRAIPKSPPLMPRGVKLVAWRPVLQPVVLNAYTVVGDVGAFISYTLGQLAVALEGKPWQAGNWTARELMERLEQVGVKVEIEGSRPTC